jgi:hypothetical protein
MGRQTVHAAGGGLQKTEINPFLARTNRLVSDQSNPNGAGHCPAGEPGSWFVRGR